MKRHDKCAWLKVGGLGICEKKLLSKVLQGPPGQDSKRQQNPSVLYILWEGDSERDTALLGLWARKSSPPTYSHRAESQKAVQFGAGSTPCRSFTHLDIPVLRIYPTYIVGPCELLRLSEVPKQTT